MFGSTSFVIFSSSPLVGELAARRTGDIVEDGRLKAAPEPGHSDGRRSQTIDGTEAYLGMLLIWRRGCQDCYRSTIAMRRGIVRSDVGV